MVNHLKSGQIPNFSAFWDGRKIIISSFWVVKSPSYRHLPHLSQANPMPQNPRAPAPAPGMVKLLHSLILGRAKAIIISNLTSWDGQPMVKQPGN
jgi:hypothetical protein